MRWADIPRNPKRSTLRWFAAIWLGWFAVLSGLAWYRQDDTAGVVLAVIALVVGVVGLNYPPAVRPVFVGAMMLTFPLGWAISRVLLGAVFYCVFTPLALVFKLIGRDALNRRLRPDEASYWAPKPAPDGMKSYFHLS